MAEVTAVVAVIIVAVLVLTVVIVAPLELHLVISEL